MKKNKKNKEKNKNDNIIKHIIIIQKYVRRYLIRKKILIPSSYYQTKYCYFRMTCLILEMTESESNHPSQLMADSDPLHSQIHSS